MEAVKKVYEITQEAYDKIEKSLSIIPQMNDKLNEIGSLKTPEHYTVREFILKAKIGRNKFESIKHQLNSVRVSPRKILIPHSDLLRWFRGEIQ